ncbi:Lrp/AsnC family transcriptional regulator [Sphingobium sp. CCH11-B1]|jgi:Lrp/AsnC family transcriptional regulator|uniref:Lrp/AsnC family transcriptional regulator n=1 Tax=Sphingobium sp. CCH11-B1 TaxID=1768781 RepID=UPI00082DF0FD|nr:Lrp/AsnC family transcriptional regulator [Sphingobium sp. CCH11-B1]MEA3389869.1 Lrp/AsnC family transcriptional regulator [Pseudomonadota bacterium]
MTASRPLDAIDRKLLQELQRDASISHADLAERVGASTASCWRRMRALEADGILARPVRLVNAARVGRGVNVICHIKIKNHLAETTEAFESFVAARDEIIECYSMSGDWDYLLRILVADVEDYTRFLMRTVLRHPSVATGSSHFALAQVKYTTAVPI